MTLSTEQNGLHVAEIEGNAEFRARRLHARDVATQTEGLRRLTHAFVETPDNILQELVNAAVDLCGADSAGISMEKEDGSEESFYVWVATAGRYSQFLNATLPHFPSACGICLERGRSQVFRVSQPFFDVMGVDAPVVTDGILLPWKVDQSRGTIWIMAHERPAAFDEEDNRLMETLADFTAMAVRHQRQQRTLLQHATAAAAAVMANQLAHEINNPLQALTNKLFMASEGIGEQDVQALGRETAADLERLSALTNKLLTAPREAERLQ